MPLTFSTADFETETADQKPRFTEADFAEPKPESAPQFTPEDFGHPQTKTGTEPSRIVQYAPKTAAATAKALELPKFEPPIALAPSVPGEKSIYEEETFMDKPVLKLGDAMFPPVADLTKRIGRTPGLPKDIPTTPVQEGISDVLKGAVNSLTTPRNLAYLGASMGVGATGAAGKALVSAFWTAFMGANAVQDAPQIAQQLGEEMALPEGQRSKKKIASLLTQAGVDVAMAAAPALHTGGEFGLTGKPLTGLGIVSESVAPVAPLTAEALKQTAQTVEAKAGEVTPAEVGEFKKQAGEEAGGLQTPTKAQKPAVEPTKGAETAPPSVTETTPPVPASEMPKTPTETGFRPAIRLVGGDVIVGDAGKTHLDILSEHRGDVDPREVDQRGFVDEQGKFHDREQTAQATGLPTDREDHRQHSTDLPEAKPTETKGAPDALESETTPPVRPVRDTPGESVRQVPTEEGLAPNDEGGDQGTKAPAPEAPAKQDVALSASPTEARIVEHPSVPIDFIEPSQKYRNSAIVEKYRQQIRNDEPLEPIDVIVDQETGKFSITNGHHKYEAAKLEGLKHVPVAETVYPYERQYENKEGLRHVERPGHATGLERREGAKLGYTPGTSAAEKIGERPYSMAARPIRGDQLKGGQPYTIDQFPSAEAYGRWVQRGRPVSPSGGPILEPISPTTQSAAAGEGVPSDAAKPSVSNEQPTPARTEPPAAAPTQPGTEGTTAPVSGAGLSVGPGGASPEEFISGGGSPTAMKYRLIDQERQQRGLAPLVKGDSIPDQAVWDRAMAEVDRNPSLPDDLVASILEKPRVISDLENHVLLLHKIALRDAYEKSAREAIQAYEDSKQFPDRKGDMVEANLRTAAWSDKLTEVERASRFSGSERGRALRSLQVMANEDFSLASLEMQERAARGGAPITDTERADLQKLADEYKVRADKLETYLSERDTKIADLEAQAALDKVARESRQAAPEIHPKILKIAEEFVKKLDVRADAARERIKARLSRTSAGVDPTVIVDLAEIGASHLAHKILDFAKWSEKMIADVGDWVKPHLEEVFSASQKNIDAIAESHPERSKIPKIKEAMAAPDIEQVKEATVDKIKDLASKGKKDSISYYVQKLARMFYQNGIRDRTKMVDALHEVISKAIPDISRREVMDAFSGYGDYKQLSKDAITVGLRDLKGQLQQVGKIEDMLAKQAPEKSGVERRTPTDEERRLIKQVEELKRRGGYTVTVPTTQLRSALQTLKTRLSNEISDLDYQIKSKSKIVKTKTQVIPDAEATRLKAQRDALKEEFDKVFPKQGITDAQKIQAAIKATERSLAEYERKVKEGDLSPMTKTTPGPTSPELESVRAKRDAAREQLQELRDLADPKKTPEERALQAFKTRTTNRIEELTQKLADKDFTTKQRRPVVMDEEASKLQADKERLAKQFQRGLAQKRLAERSTVERGGDWISKWRRGFILSGPVTLAKLTSAAVQRMAINPIENLIGSAIGEFIPEVSRKSPTEGGFNVRAEAKAFTKGLTIGMKDAWQTLKTGQSDLDVLYGKEALLPPTAIDFFGHVHGALKAPVKRAAFERALETKTQWAIENGVDVSDPLIQSGIIVDAYKRANRDIFQQDNRLASAWKNFVQGLERKDKVTGQVPLAGKVGSTVARVLVPIVKIPTNIVAETMQYATGTVTGSARLARAFYNGVENLKPEEADLIMRSLKKGTLGAAAMLIGYFNAENIGGYYQPGQKRDKKDVKAGFIRIPQDSPLLAGKSIPSFVLHNPLLEAFQIGATVRRVADSKLRKKDKEDQGLAAGVYAAGAGLASEIPFARETLEITKAFNPHQKGQFFGELGKSLLIPQFMQWTAQYMDKDAEGNPIQRKTDSTTDYLKSGVPGLRQKLPKKKAK